MTVVLQPGENVDNQSTDPFAQRGPFRDRNGDWWIRAWLPGARAVSVVERNGESAAPLTDHNGNGYFSGRLPARDDRPAPSDYQLRIDWPDAVQLTHDPYAFDLLLNETDLWLHAEGTHERPYVFLGAHCVTVAGIDGVRFAIWAPNAGSVAVVGDFNAWDTERHVMRLRREAGIWEIFLPGVSAGQRYKFALTNAQGHAMPWRADPYARASERSPSTASIISDTPLHGAPCSAGVSHLFSAGPDDPVSIYELHPGSWQRDPEDPDRMLNWYELSDTLVPYVADLGFTHIELMPVAEFPFDGSWGYQPTGLFAPSARFGDMRGLRHFVQTCHDSGIGVLLDWVPGHFPSDAHALAQLDGTSLFEHADPREGVHPDWQSLIYNFGRNEIRCFLAGSARYWIEEFGFDGLRVDAVASMLYRDYSRKDGEWIPNADGGRENYEAIALLRHVNESLGRTHPQAVTIAEESTAWPGVSKPVDQGGLGFHFKWNMGWMNDTLRFMGRDPAHRKYHLEELTFGLMYAFSEQFVLPLSHDEVVHGKGTLLGRMPGSREQQFANLRLYLAFMFAHPGKKLLFMGGEFGQDREWNHDHSLDWHLVQPGSLHQGLSHLVGDMNRLYRHKSALHQRDADPAGFKWVVVDDAENTVLAFLRRGEQPRDTLLAVFNFTPVTRTNYRVGVPVGGQWAELLNTDASAYGGSDLGNCGAATATATASHDHDYSVTLTLPGLSAVFLEPAGA